jgi:hypothetical protein
MIGALSLILVVMGCLAAADKAKRPTVGRYTATQLLWQDDFQKDLSQWAIEQQPGGSTKLNQGTMEIDDRGGCTVWFRQKLEAPVLIEFDVTMIKAGGRNDRTSDLNCFTMAVDLKHPQDILTNGKKRAGKFKNYHDLRLYYVGYGANNNKTARFRRYPGDGSRPVKPEHDLKATHKPNKIRRVQILVADGTYQFWIDGKNIYNVSDPKPYRSGWFGFRTVKNHMKIQRFRVWRVERS